MAKGKKPKAKRPIESYEHRDKKRANNPPVGLVTPETDPDAGAKKTYAYDPHLDPQLVWAGKAEHTAFEVPTVSLHVHERIDPRTIIEAVRRRNGSGNAQPSLFEQLAENPPLRQAIEFYKHAHGWSNRLIAGDSLLVMNSLLEKEGLAGKVQTIYIDPPYGIKYGSNFQPFVNKRDVKDRNDEDLTQEPEMIRAFRDTWEIGIHSYLTYLRDRLLLAKELLHQTGSVFLQISEENVHHVRELMDEVFGVKNCVSLITFTKTTAQSAELLPTVADYLLWYARDKQRVKYRPLYQMKELHGEGGREYQYVAQKDGSVRGLTETERLAPEKLPKGARVFALHPLTSQRPPGDFPVTLEGKEFRPRTGYWKTGIDGMQNLIRAGRIVVAGSILKYRRYFDDFLGMVRTNVWSDVSSGASMWDPKVYVVQTNTRVVGRSGL
jgi:hypothetical protein